MAGELVRFQGVVMTRDEALELVRVRQEANAPTPRHFADVPVNRNQPLRIDVMRLCAAHGRPWAAIYIRQGDGSYRYAKSIRVTKALYRTQYTPGTQEVVTLDRRWLDEEECAWCGSCEEGIFWCGNCRKTVCGGMSNGRYFRCHCGGEGWVEDRELQHVAFVPRIG